MAVNRQASIEWYRRNRRRSEEIFASLRPEAYYDRPISLRNPICFYEGHLPAFGVNTLVKRGLGEPGIDARLEKLRDRIRGDKKYGRSIGFRYHDGKPGIVEGLLSRGDRRVAP